LVTPTLKGEAVSGKRVISPRMKRMTPKDPLDTQPKPMDSSEPENGFTGVFRTGGIKTTGFAFKGRNGDLIKPDQRYQGNLRNAHGFRPV